MEKDPNQPKEEEQIKLFKNSWIFISPSIYSFITLCYNKDFRATVKEAI